jgi:ABC-type multidrug transport system ATPase subunit
MVILEAAALEKAYRVRRVLRAVSLRVEAGERVILLGENGSGKSTLLQVLAGVLQADAGQVEVRGTVGFGPEKPDLPDHLVVAEWLDLIASLKGMRRRPDSPFGVDAFAGIKLGALSLGQRQRVSLAAAWLGAPSLLLLDEPTNAIDEGICEEFEGRLAQETTVIATHDRALADRVGTRVLAMRAGALSPA